ncbi:zinc-binding dehydrogenase [Escherichia coli]
MGDVMLQLVKEGKLDPLVEKTISLDEVPEALTQLASRTVTGKIIAVL